MLAACGIGAGLRAIGPRDGAAGGRLGAADRRPAHKRTCLGAPVSYPAAMTQIYSMPGHLIRRLHQISSSVFAEGMRAHGHDLTSPQFAALALLHDNPGIDQATLAGLIAQDRPTIGGVVDRLVAKGLVERRVSAEDRRARILMLTPAGAQLLARLLPIVTALQADILPGLSPAERAEFLRLARKVTKAGNARSRAPLMLPGDGGDGPS